MKRVSLIVLLLLLTGLFTTAAQSPTATPVNPNAQITWPPPVYIVSGDFEIRGTANVPNMTAYYLEFRQRNSDLSIPAQEVWLPITMPSSTPILQNALGVWNTRTTSDGVYDLRLTIAVQGGQLVFAAIGPVRVENNPPPFAQRPNVQPTLALPTLIPTPTAFSGEPTVMAVRDANVRKGDSTSYEVVGSLLNGNSASVLGVSALGSGWYLIRLPNGTQGWIAPSVVQASGNFANVPRVNPPPLPTATPIPATATPNSAINLVAGNFSFAPGSPNCNQPFNVFMDVANFGTIASPGTILSVTDFRRADGSFQTSNIGAIPPINPGQTVNVGPITLTVSTFYNEDHRLFMVIDPNNTIVEMNKNDNFKEAFYFLNKALCP